MINYGSLKVHSPEQLIVIPDIHGEFEKLSNLLDKILPYLESPQNHMVFCGDYTNHKGNSSPKVLLKLIELKKTYPNQTFFIEGNHEEMLWKCLNKDFSWFEHCNNTLKQMMLEWEIPHNELKPMSYISEIYKECEKRGVIEFYEGLIPYYETNSTVCTHAPLDKSLCMSYGLNEYKNDYTLGIPKKYFLDRMLFDLKWGNTIEDYPYAKININKQLVCGHQYKHHKQPRLLKNRAFLDTGCGVDLTKPLVCLVLPGKKILH